MKRNSLPFLFIILFYLPNYSQHCEEIVSFIPGESILEWDWTQPQFEVYIKPPGTQSSIHQFIDSPFYQSTVIGQPNTSFLADAPIIGEPLDFDPDDGWELLIKEFGNDSEGGGIRFPVFVLYNRIEGKMRSFFYVADVSGVHEIILNVSHYTTAAIKYITAAMEHANTPMQWIEGYEDLSLVNETPNVFEGSSGIWAMSEIPILYDPCACTFESGLKVQSFSVNSTDIEIELDGTGVIEQIIEGGNTLPNDAKGFNINSIGAVAEGASKEGSKAYKSSSKFIKDLDKILVKIANDNIDDEVKDVLQQLGFGDEVDADELREMFDMISQAGVPPASNLANAFNSMLPQTVSSILPAWIKDAVPYAGAALAAIDFLVSGAKKSPPKPMKFNTNAKFTGSGNITETVPLQSIEFYTPGSNNTAGSAAKIPIYNHILGVFSVVEKVSVGHHKGYDVDEDGAYYHDAYQLKASPKYAVNPFAGLKTQPIDIKASLHFFNPGPLSDYPPLAGSYFSSGLIKVEENHYRTPYVPLSCLPDYTVHLYETRLGEGLCLECHQVPEVRMHILASFERSSGSPESETEMIAQMYQVSLESPSGIIGQNPFLDIKENETTDNLTDILDGTITAWNDITYTGDILVTEDNKGKLEELFFPPQVVEVHVPGQNGNPGYTTTENIFQVLPAVGTTLNGPLVLQNPPSCSQESFPVDKSFLEGFCQNLNKYNPLGALREGEYNGYDSTQIEDISVNLFPNPAQELLNISLSIPQNSEIKICVKNQLDQIIVPFFTLHYSEGKHLHPIDCSNFAKGMYIVELIANGLRLNPLKFIKL